MIGQGWNLPPGLVPRDERQEVQLYCQEAACGWYGPGSYTYETDTGAGFYNPEDCPDCGGEVDDTRPTGDLTPRHPPATMSSVTVNGLLGGPMTHLTHMTPREIIRGLMRGDPETFQRAYSAENAVTAACELRDLDPAARAALLDYATGYGDGLVDGREA